MAVSILLCDPIYTQSRGDPGGSPGTARARVAHQRANAEPSRPSAKHPQYVTARLGASRPNLAGPSLAQGLVPTGPFPFQPAAGQSTARHLKKTRVRTNPLRYVRDPASQAKLCPENINFYTTSKNREGGSGGGGVQAWLGRSSGQVVY